MPWIKPNAIGPVGPDTITVTFSGIPNVGIARAIQVVQERAAQPVFGLSGDAVLVVLPQLGRCAVESIVLPADTTASARLQALAGAFAKASCTPSTVTIGVNFTCGGVPNLSIQLLNARTIVVGAQFSANFLFIAQMQIAFSNFG